MNRDLAGFLKDIRNGGSPLSPLDCGRARALYHPADCPPEQAAELAVIANRPLPGLTLYKFGSRSIVGSFPLADGTRAVLKYYYPSSPPKHLAYGIKGSRCHQSWIAGLALNHIGIPTPAPLAIAEWSLLGGLWLSKSFLATAQAPGVSLLEFADRQDPSSPLMEKVVSRLHHAFSLMAAHRTVHGDMKANNILVSDTGDITFIDLDATEFLLPESTWRSLREKDRKRFFKNWNDRPHLAKLFQHVFDEP